MKAKVLLLCLLALVMGPRLVPAADWQDEYGRLLAKYVTPAGVRYAAWKGNEADMASIQRVVDAIGSAPASEGTSKDDLAFYINAYNAWILDGALGKYPVKSVKDATFSFFILNHIKVAGQKMSFNHLEKDVIRERFKEPRVHFALNCASRSCPPLNPEPFRGKDLDAQLEKLARAFVNSERGVKVKSKTAVDLSKIFDWYKDDFAAVGGPMAFINKYRTAKIPENAKVTFQEYNWMLNEAK